LTNDPTPRRSTVPRDLAAGIFLIVLGAIAIAGTYHLPDIQPQGIGAGLLPKATGAIVGAFGIYLVVRGLTVADDFLDRWAIREIVFVLGAVLLFAWTIRPLGLVIAGPLAVLVASRADRESRLMETLVFAAVITAFCIGLFSYGLRLPIPVMPTSLPYPLDTLVGR
jgi:hypothetical protein